MPFETSAPLNGIQPTPAEPLFDQRKIRSDIGAGSFIPIYGRSALDLARLYGYLDHQDLADDLPNGAQVLDVGAGASTLGLEVCRANPNIRWVNADICYGEPDISDALAALQDLPSNLEFLAVDVLDLPEAVGERVFDRTFSFFMIAHIELADPQVALVGAQNILKVTKPTGQLDLGPVKNMASTYALKFGSKDSISLKAPKSEAELQTMAPWLVEKLKLKGLAAQSQREVNRAL